MLGYNVIFVMRLEAVMMKYLNKKLDMKLFPLIT